MSEAPVWRTLAELGWNPPAVEPEPDPISWRLPASALRERCETCGGSRCVVPPDCDCDVVTSLNFALCPHPPAECPDCQPVLEPLSAWDTESARQASRAVDAWTARPFPDTAQKEAHDEHTRVW